MCRKEAIMNSKQHSSSWMLGYFRNNPPKELESDSSNGIELNQGSYRSSAPNQVTLIIQASTEALSPTFSLLMNLSGLNRIIQTTSRWQASVPKQLNDAKTEQLPIELTTPLPEPIQEELRELTDEYEKRPKKEEFESLNRIAFTQEKLSELKNNLLTFMNSIEFYEDKSYLTAWARAWGPISKWKRLLGGTIITAVPLSVALTTQLPVLLAVSSVFTGMFAVGYGGTDFLLTDLYKNKKPMDEYIQKVKDGVLSIADVLGWSIQSMNLLERQLAKDLVELKRQNSTYRQLNEQHSTNIDHHYQKMELIERNILITLQEQDGLSSTKSSLAKHLKKLEAHAQTNASQLERGEEQLAELDRAYELITQKLSEHVGALQQEKNKLNQEVATLRTVGKSLQDALALVASSNLESADAREAFKEKIDKFVSDKEQSFADITARASQTQKELETTKNELQATQQKLDAALLRQERLIDRLTALEKNKLQGISPVIRTGLMTNVLEDPSQTEPHYQSLV